MPAFQPYWGKPAVRNDRGDRGNVGIIRSPVRASILPDRAVKTGVVDMGWCFHGYWPETTPLSDVITLPFVPFASAEKGSEVLWNLYEKFPAIQKEFADIHPLMLWTSNPYF